MKYRNGFVSNSSSSSFILFKAYLTEEQINYIKNWKTFAVSEEYRKMLEEYAKTHEIEDHINTTIDWSDPEQEKRVKVKKFSFDDFPYCPEGWTVEEVNDVFDIHTSMDNFNMEQFLAVIGVDVEKTGLRLEDHHSFIVGRNDAKSDIRDFVTDSHFFENYEEEYWLTSKDYKDRVYKSWVESNEKILKDRPELKDQLSWPREPKVKKKWICEDAGNALNDVAKKIRDIAIKNGVYCFERLSDGNYIDDKTRLYMEILEAVDEVKENWRAIDEYDDSTPEDNASQRVVAALEGEGYFNSKEVSESSKTEDIDESQLVIASIEDEGYLSEENERKYNEEINKLYKPLGVNINNL